MNHWIHCTNYSGLPWEFGKSGLESFDCWGYVVFIQGKHYGLQLPMLDYKHNWRETAALLLEHEERANWVQVDTPIDGDLVMMSRSRLPVHIGVWVNTGNESGISHCVEGSGVGFISSDRLAFSGWNKLEFYRHI